MDITSLPLDDVMNMIGRSGEIITMSVASQSVRNSSSLPGLSGALFVVVWCFRFCASS
jgi:hypothetical protein